MKTAPLSYLITVIAMGSLAIGNCAHAQEKAPELKVEREFGSRFLRHPGAYASPSISPDGRYLASCGTDGFVRIWDLEMKKQVRQIGVGKFRKLCSVDYSPDGKQIVTATEEGTIILLDIETGKNIHEIVNSGLRYLMCRFSPDGKEIIAVDDLRSSRIKIWDVKSGKPTKRFQGNRTSVNSFDISRDGKLLVTAEDHNDPEVHLWDFATGEKKRTFYLDDDVHGVEHVAFNRSGKRLVTISKAPRRHAGDLSGHERPHCIIWDTASGKQLQKIGLKGWHTYAFFSANDDRVIVSTRRGRLSEFDVKTGKLIRSKNNRLSVNKLALAKGGNFLLGFGGDGTVSVIDMKTLAPVNYGKGSLTGAAHCQLTADGNLLITAHWGGTVRIWDLTGKNECRALNLSPQSADTTGQFRIDLSPDESQALVTTKKTVELLDVVRAKHLRTYSFPDAMIVSASFSHDGKDAYIAANMAKNKLECGRAMRLNLESGKTKPIPGLDKYFIRVFRSARGEHPKRDLFFIAQDNGEGWAFDDDDDDAPKTGLRGSVWDLKNQIRCCRIEAMRHLECGDFSSDFRHAVMVSEYDFETLYYFALPEIVKPAAKLSGKQITDLVRRLGADSLQDQRQARDALKSLKDQAIPFLESAAKDKDPEIRMEAEKTLKAIRTEQATTVVSPYSLERVGSPNANYIRDVDFQPKSSHWIAATGNFMLADQLVFGTIHKEKLQLRISQRVPLRRHLKSFIVNPAGTRIIALNADTTITVYGIPKALQAPRNKKAKE